jgi:predicted nucleic acid-binding protein
MMFLLDTNVISELRKAHPAGKGSSRLDANVRNWIESVPASDLFLSAITILELELGFLLLERLDPRQGALLRTWVRNLVLPSFSGRILAVDVAVAQRCAMLHVPDPMEDRDSLIAATALVHGMTVVTRNVSHFQRTGVTIHDPWQSEFRAGQSDI